MRIYYGWCIVAMSLVAMMLTMGTTLTGYGMFVVPVSQDMQLSRANVNTGIIFINIGNAVMSPFLGRFIDVFPIRRIMTVCAILFGVGLITLGLSHNVWLSAFMLAVPVALGIGGGAALSFTTLVARWFVAQRGRAMAITVIGISLGTVVMPQIIALLLGAVGWRQCLIILGIATTAVFLLMIPFVRERPGSDDIEPRRSSEELQAPTPRAQASDEIPMKVGQILRIPVFWMYTLSVAFSLAAMQTIAVSIVPIARESQLSNQQAASLLTAIGLMSIFSKVVLAAIGDWFDREKVLAILFCGIAVASSVLLTAESYAALLISSALIGFAVGAVTPMFYALLADRVGAVSFGTANGAATTIMSFFGIVALRFGGEVYDRTGTYDLMFIAFIAVGIVSAVLMLASRRFSRVPPVIAAA